MGHALSRRFGGPPKRPEPAARRDEGVGPPSRRRRRIGTPARPGRAGVTRPPAPMRGPKRKGAFLANHVFSQHGATVSPPSVPT